MGEKTDRTLRALKGINGKAKWLGGLSLTAVALFALQQGWIAIAFETTAHAASTYETQVHAAETYETKASAEIGRVRTQAILSLIEQEHGEQMGLVRQLQLDLTRLLVLLEERTGK